MQQESNTMNQTVAFLGAGNMAGAIIGGLIESGMAADNITATSPDSAAQDAVREKYGIHSHADNQKAAESRSKVPSRRANQRRSLYL